MSLKEEEDRLIELLNVEDLPPGAISRFSAFSAESKDDVMAQIARTLQPAPSGKVLARLPNILTEQNRADMELAYLSNLRSSYPDARRASLDGLALLNYAGFIDLAILTLRDESDQVLATACDLLLPKAKQEPRLWKILLGVYAAHKGDPQFHLTVSFLEAHGITGQLL